MTNESPPNNGLKNVWQNQRLEGTRMSADDIRRKARKFRSEVVWRNAREYAAALVLVVFSGFQIVRITDAVTRVGFGLLIAGTLYMAWQLHGRGSSRGLPAEMGLASGLDFFKRELERQRDLLQHVWRWYLGPLVPGLIVLMAGGRTNPPHLRHFAVSSSVFNLLVAAFFVFVWRLNLWAAGKLQRRIDELDALQK